MAFVLIPQADGTIYTNGTYSPSSPAFDGADNDNAGCAQYYVDAIGYLGKDWGAGVTHTVTRYRLKTSTNRVDFRGGGGSASIDLEGSADASSWTSLHSSTTGAPGNNTWVDFTTGITTTTAYRYHRIVLGQAGAGGSEINELEFYENSKPAPLIFRRPTRFFTRRF